MGKENVSQKDEVTWLALKPSRQAPGWSSSNYFTPIFEETCLPDPDGLKPTFGA